MEVIENFCYECGNVIDANRYFCDEQCLMSYSYRFREKDIIKRLTEQTNFRKRTGLPHSASDVTSLPKTEIDHDKKEEPEKMENDKLHHRLHIKSFSETNRIRGKYLELTFLGWERIKDFKCICNIYTDEICHYKGKIPIKPKPENLKCSVLKIGVSNISSQLIGVNFCDHHSQMIDTDGNIHEAKYLCDDLQPRGWRSFSCDLYDGTNAKFYLIFPELENGADLMRFIYNQSIFDPGATSGWVRETETFDFTFASLPK